MINTNEMNKVMVTINGSDYPMVGNKSEQEMRNVASYVDSEIQRVKEKNPRLSLSVASIVTALNITDILFECSKENDELRKENDEIKKQIGTSDEELKLEIRKLKLSLDGKTKSFEEQKLNLESLTKEVEDKISQINELNQQLQLAKEEVKGYNVQIDELNVKVDEGEERAKIAESLASEFQNKSYAVQLKLTELENKFKEFAVTI